MGHLGESDNITTINKGEEILLTDSTGQTFKMKTADLAEAVRQVMPAATAEKNGLMSTTFFNSIPTRTADIEAESIFDTGIKNGCLFMIRNITSTNEVGIALLDPSTLGVDLRKSSQYTFFNESGNFSIYREKIGGHILIKNNSLRRCVVSYRAFIL